MSILNLIVSGQYAKANDFIDLTLDIQPAGLSKGTVQLFLPTNVELWDSSGDNQIMDMTWTLPGESFPTEAKAMPTGGVDSTIVLLWTYAATGALDIEPITRVQAMLMADRSVIGTTGQDYSTLSHTVLGLVKARWDHLNRGNLRQNCVDRFAKSSWCASDHDRTCRLT